MALYFQCQINKNPLLRLFFGDFAHWDTALSELPRGWSQRRHYKYEDKKHVGKQSGRRFWESEKSKASISGVCIRGTIS